MEGEVGRQGHRAGVAFQGRSVLAIVSEEFAEEALAADPPQHAQILETVLEGVDGVDELPVLLGRLGEADTRVNDDAFAVDG